MNDPTLMNMTGGFNPTVPPQTPGGGNVASTVPTTPGSTLKPPGGIAMPAGGLQPARPVNLKDVYSVTQLKLGVEKAMA